MLFCVVCHVKLTGRKTRYCGETCRKRAQRHPDLYAPSPKAVSYTHLTLPTTPYV